MSELETIKNLLSEFSQKLSAFTEGADVRVNAAPSATDKLQEQINLQEAERATLLRARLGEYIAPLTQDIEEDEENLEIWEELSQINLPVFGYENDGEIYVKDEILMNVKPSMHTVWFLSEESYDYMMDLDLLLFDPIIKNFSIAQKLIREYGLHPFETDYDEDDLDDYEEPDVSAVTIRRTES